MEGTWTCADANHDAVCRRDADADPCTEWWEAGICFYGCRNGICQPAPTNTPTGSRAPTLTPTPCVDECVVGSVDCCPDGIYLRECQRGWDADSCSEWGPCDYTYCNPGFHCENGACWANPENTPTPIPTLVPNLIIDRVWLKNIHTGNEVSVPSVGDEVYIMWEMHLVASPGTVLEVPVRLTMNGAILPTTNPTYWLDPTLTITAHSRDPYTVIDGIQTAKVELDPQNLILETSDSDNVGWYVWESYAINVPTSTPTRTPTSTPTGTRVPSPTPTASPTPSPTTDLCQPSGGGAMLTGFGGGAAAINFCPAPPGNGLRGLAGRCLDVAGASTSNGAKIQLYQCNSTNAQTWRFENGTVRAVGGKCLDVTGGSTVDGTTIQIWDCNGNPQQTFSFNDGQLVGIGGKCATVSGSSTDNGTRVVLGTCGSTDAQRFSYIEDGKFVTIGGKCLDVAGSGSSENGNPLQIWDCADVAQQKFVLQGMILRAGTGGCLDVTNNQTANGTTVQQWACFGGANQRWNLNGNQLTGLGGKCLDVKDGTTANGTQVQIWDCWGGVQQRWFRTDQAFHPVAPLVDTPGTVLGSCKFGGYCARDVNTKAHSGVDYSIGFGKQVRAICDGEIIIAKTAATTTCAPGELPPCIWSRFTIVKYKNCGGYSELYGYNGHVDPKVVVGQKPKRGDIIATVGEWINDPGNEHLHHGLARSMVYYGWGYPDVGVSTVQTCGLDTDPNAPDNVRSKALAEDDWIDPHSFGSGYRWWGNAVAIGSCN